MRRQYPIKLIGFTLLATLGCAGARIESNVRPNYAKRIDRLYVIISTPDSASRKSLVELRAQLIGRLEQRSVHNEVHVMNASAQEEQAAIRAEIEQFTPNHILTVTQTGKTTLMGPKGGESDHGATFELLLQEPGDDTAVWKAALVTSTLYGSVADPVKTADTILASLEKDGLLPHVKVP